MKNINDDLLEDIMNNGFINVKNEKGEVSIQIGGKYHIVIKMVESIISSLAYDMVKEKIEPRESKAFTKILMDILISRLNNKNIICDMLNNSKEMNDVITKLANMDEQDFDEVLKKLK